MHSLSKQQKLENLQENFKLKLLKYKNLENELNSLKMKIEKLKVESSSSKTQEVIEESANFN